MGKSFAIKNQTIIYQPPSSMIAHSTLEIFNIDVLGKFTPKFVLEGVFTPYELFPPINFECSAIRSQIVNLC